MHKIIYSACISGQTVCRKYSSDIQAIKSFKKIAIKRNGKLTDITKQHSTGYGRIIFN
jgi:hypothetical protein